MLLARALLSQMDVPARQSFVMAVVPPEERAAAASVTNVPRSLAAATTPLLAGVLLARTTFGWPLLIAGVTKFVYDALLLFLYRDVPERRRRRTRPPRIGPAGGHGRMAHTRTAGGPAAPAPVWPALGCVECGHARAFPFGSRGRRVW